MKLNHVTNGNKSISNPILVGLLYTFSIVFISLLIVVLIFYFTSFSDKNLTLTSYIVNGLGLLIGGYTAGKRAGSKGWYYGGLTGLIYGIILISIGFLAIDTDFNLRSLIIILIAFLIAAFGGIFGVNTKR